MADVTEISEEKLDNLVDTLLPVERAAVILLLLGEEQAAEIISYMSPREVQIIGRAYGRRC